MYSKEYRNGYLAGIKRVLNLIKNLDEDGIICDHSSSSIAMYGFITFQHVVKPITDLYNGLSKSDNSSGLGLSPEQDGSC